MVRLVDFSDANIDHITPWDEETLPSRLKKADCFLDVDGPGGEFTPEEIGHAIKLAASRGEGKIPARRVTGKGPPGVLISCLKQALKFKAGLTSCLKIKRPLNFSEKLSRPIFL